jgi:hypothetical protein
MTATTDKHRNLHLVLQALLSSKQMLVTKRIPKRAKKKRTTAWTRRLAVVWN